MSVPAPGIGYNSSFKNEDELDSRTSDEKGFADSFQDIKPKLMRLQWAASGLQQTRKSNILTRKLPRRNTMGMGFQLRKKFPRRMSVGMGFRRNLQVVPPNTDVQGGSFSTRPYRNSLPTHHTTRFDPIHQFRNTVKFKAIRKDALRDFGVSASISTAEMGSKELHPAIFTTQRKNLTELIFKNKPKKTMENIKERRQRSSLLSTEAAQQLINRHVLPNTISPVNLILHLLLSITLVVLFFEIQWFEVEEMWKPNFVLGNGIKWLQSIVTLSLSFQYWKMIRQETEETLTSSLWGYFNQFIILLHVPPFLPDILDKYSLIMLCRVFCVGIDVYRITHPYWSQRVAIRQIMSNNTILSRMYIIRAGLLQEPVLLGLSFCYSYNVVVAYAIYVIEREQQDGFGFFKALYYNVIVFTGVGLGDEVILSTIARLLTALTAFVGFTCMGFIVTGLLGLIKMAESEMEAGQVWELVSLRAAMEYTAACIIQRFWRAILSVKKEKTLKDRKLHRQKKRSKSLNTTPIKNTLKMQLSRMARRGSDSGGEITKSNAEAVKKHMQTLGSQLTLTQSRLEAVVNKFATPKQQGGISDSVFKKCDLPQQTKIRRRRNSSSIDIPSELNEQIDSIAIEKMIRDTERRRSLPSHAARQRNTQAKAFLLKNSVDHPKVKLPYHKKRAQGLTLSPHKPHITNPRSKREATRDRVEKT